MSADIKNLKNLQNKEYNLKKLFDDAEVRDGNDGSSWEVKN